MADRAPTPVLTRKTLAEAVPEGDVHPTGATVPEP